RIADEDVGSQGDQFFREALSLLGARGRKSVVYSQAAAFRPAELLEALPERQKTGLRLGIVLGIADEHSDPPNLDRLLGTRGKRPHRSSADKCSELAAAHANSFPGRGPYFQHSKTIAQAA